MQLRSINYKYKQSLFQMNWDCTLFMRSSLDDRAQINNKIPTNKLNVVIQNVQNPIIHYQKPLKPKNKQFDKSKELKKKMSLKSKSNSTNKKYEPHYELKENVFNQVQKFYAPTSRTYLDKSQNQSRLRTESSYSNAGTLHLESYPSYQGTATSRQIEFIPPCLSSPTFKAAIKKSISMNNTHYNQPNTGQTQLKITQFCEVPSATRISVNRLTVNELKKIKPVVKINNHQIKDNFQGVVPVHSAKHLVYVNGRQVTNKNVTKEFNKNENQKPLLNSIEMKIQKNLEESQKEIKKQKIQDFLNSKQVTKSVRDSGQLSQQSQCSRVVITYGQILKEHGKFHLDS